AEEVEQGQLTDAGRRLDRGHGIVHALQGGALEVSVPDQLVGLVRPAHGFVPREGGGVAGRGRDRVQRKQLVDRLPGAEHRPGTSAAYARPTDSSRERVEGSVGVEGIGSSGSSWSTVCQEPSTGPDSTAAASPSP